MVVPLSVRLILFLLLFPVWVNGQTAHYYFGTLHAHSGYSDGNKDSLVSGCSTPLADFEYAKGSQQMDFLGISEHNHLGAGMHKADYFKGIAEANLANVDGDFVCLYGMEWGEIASGGHLIIYGVDSLIGWDNGNYHIYNAQEDYTGLFAKLASRPNAFCYFAHPQTGDYNDLIGTVAYNAVSDKAIVGSPFRSGPAFSLDTTFSDPSSGNYLSKWFKALAKGYHLGMCLDHDTHNTVFGRSQMGRTAIIADTLTQASVLDAYHQMRMYATDDWNTEVTFSANGHVMGSVVDAQGIPTISVGVADPDLEEVASITLYYGVPGSGLTPTVLSSNTDSLSLTYTHTIEQDSTFYYYAKIVQADGDQIYTSPIWYTRDDYAAIAEPKQQGVKGLSVLPNPNAGTFVLRFETALPQSFPLEVFNCLGECVYRESLDNVVGSFAKLVSLDGLAKGVYVLKVGDGMVRWVVE